MVFGILSIAACPLLGIVAIILYYRAKAEMRDGGYGDSSHTFAKAGLIMGIIGICLTGIYLLIALIGVAM